MRRSVPQRAAFVLGGLLGALAGLTGAGGVVPQVRAAAARWFVLAAYPGARPLCSEHVMGAGRPRMEIEWRSFATRDPVEAVVRFYEQDQGQKAQPDRAPGSFELTPRQDDAVRLAIFPAAQAKRYPGCEKQAAAGETVILVSRATREK